MSDTTGDKVFATFQVEPFKDIYYFRDQVDAEIQRLQAELAERDERIANQDFALNELKDQACNTVGLLAERIDSMKAYYESVIADGTKRIAELDGQRKQLSDYVTKLEQSRNDALNNLDKAELQSAKSSAVSVPKNMTLSMFFPAQEAYGWSCTVGDAMEFLSAADTINKPESSV